MNANNNSSFDEEMNLIKKRWGRFNQYRKLIKHKLSLILIPIILLIIAETLIARSHQIWMDPTVAWVGMLWIILTQLWLWVRGGVVYDMLITARLIDTQLGRDFTLAHKIYFLIQTTIVAFFFFVPIWHFWAAYWILFILLTGWLLSGSLAGRPWPWKEFWKSYVTGTFVIIGLIILAAVYKTVFQSSFYGDGISCLRGFSPWVWKVGLFGLIILAIGFIPKVPMGIRWIGALFIISAAALCIFSPEKTKTIFLDELPANQSIFIERKSQQYPPPVVSIITKEGKRFEATNWPDPELVWRVSYVKPEKTRVYLKVHPKLSKADFKWALQPKPAKKVVVKTRPLPIAQPCTAFSPSKAEAAAFQIEN